MWLCCAVSKLIAVLKLSLAAVSRGSSPAAVCGLTAEASLLAERGLWGTGPIAVLHSLAGLPWWHNWQRTHLPTQETQIPSLGRDDPWRRKWQPTPVFLPGKPHGQRSLAGYSPWGHEGLRHNLAAKITTGLVAHLHMGSSWITSPALAGGFFSIAPPGKCRKAFNAFLPYRKSGRWVWKLNVFRSRKLVKMTARKTGIHQHIYLYHPFSTHLWK